MSIRKAFAAAVLLSAMLVTGCASVPMASPERDAKAKTFATQPGKANIYIYRNESIGAAVKMPVMVDGKLVGDTVSKTFILTSVNPGKHTILSKTENDSTLDIMAERGKNYFVWQEVKMGMWSARSSLQLVGEATGKKSVGECKLVEGVQ
ncbi:MAG TPA: DUF2846 domain-containing protein [Burkholderiales bacterium]|nr:DUF2846 domain-containing protein [Burkholderiales bacterium]